MVPSTGSGLGGWGGMSGSGGWWPIVREPFTGAWQRNMEMRADTMATYEAVYSCVTLIASDVSKARLMLVERDQNHIWAEVMTQSPYAAVLRKPNRFQNRIKFIEQWIVSKLIHGNTFVLKERDGRGIVTDLYILDPTRTRPLVSPDGSVFYQLAADNLTGIAEAVTVPASEIIHDVMVPLYHPLCGVSPLSACGLAVTQGMNIQRNSAAFFANGSRPSGVLSTPDKISDIDSAEFKAKWQENFAGSGAGTVAVLGNGLTYSSMVMTSVDAQLIEQLRWSSQSVCSVFHVPTHKVGIGELPKYDNIEALDQQYYSQCIQAHMENIEASLNDGLEFETVPGKTYGVQFDLDDLLRMDSVRKVEAAAKATGAGIMKIDEARRKFDLGPTAGGDACYLQVQNYSLEALAKRDAQDDPFAPAKAPTPPAPAADPAPSATANDNAAAMTSAIHRSWGRSRHGIP